MENNNNLNVNMVSDFQNEVSDIMFNRDVLGRYNFCMDALLVSKKNIEKFLEVLKEKYNFTRTKLSVTKKQTINLVEYKDEWMIKFYEAGEEEELVVSIYSLDYTIGSVILDLFKEYELQIEDDVIIMTSLYYEDGRIKEGSKILRSNDFADVKKEYYPYLKSDVMFEHFSKAPENILMITGEPGIGKTKLINLYMNYMLENIDAFVNNKGEGEVEMDQLKEVSVLYVKSEELLSTDKFWSYLNANQHYSLVILDDFDNFLSPRVENIRTESDNMRNKFISYFLSLTDGTLKSDIKFVITTNRKVEKMDTALLRKGRAFDVLSLRKLKNEEALKIWLVEGLKEEDFVLKFGDSEEVTQADLGSEIHVKRTFGDNEEPQYLLEDDISLLKKLRSKSGVKPKITIE